MSMFQKAERRKSRARVGFCGPSGSGKTYSALVFASVLADGGKVAVIDTEHDSAALYADEFDFDVLPLQPPFSPARYCEAIEAAAAEGYAVVVADSLSHAWEGEGGVLDIKEDIAARDRNHDSFGAWRQATPEHNRLVNALTRAPIHVVATMRTKTEYSVEKDDKNKTRIRKVGTRPVQREGLDYEFTLVFDADLDHTLVASKSRCKPLADVVVRNPNRDPKPTYEVARTFSGWLNQGADMLPTIAERVATLQERYDESDLLDAANMVRDEFGKSGSFGSPAEIAKSPENVITRIEEVLSEAGSDGESPSQPQEGGGAGNEGETVPPETTAAPSPSAEAWSDEEMAGAGKDTK